VKLMEEGSSSDWVVLEDAATPPAPSTPVVSSRTSIVEDQLPEDFVVEVAPAAPPPIDVPRPSPPPSRVRSKRYESRDVLFPPPSCVASVIEFFLIVGLRQETPEVRDPEIFFSYPRGVDERRLNTAAKFCFPERIASRRVRRSASNSSLNQLIHGSDQAFSKRHVFCFTGADGSHEWGAVLVKDELLAFVPSVVEGSESQKSVSELLEAGKSEFGAADRAYCVVSRYPLFGLHFDLLLSILAHERSMRLLSTPSSRVSPVLEEIDKAINLRLDRSINQSLRFDLFSRQVSMELPFADLGDGLDGFLCEYVLQQAFPTLLHRLSVPNLLRVFNAALLCKQILFRSRYTGVVSAVSLAASLLIRPLRWEGKKKKEKVIFFIVDKNKKTRHFGDGFALFNEDCVASSSSIHHWNCWPFDSFGRRYCS
jgi:hypothetical protein